MRFAPPLWCANPILIIIFLWKNLFLVQFGFKKRRNCSKRLPEWVNCENPGIPSKSNCSIVICIFYISIPRRKRIYRHLKVTVCFRSFAKLAKRFGNSFSRCIRYSLLFLSQEVILNGRHAKMTGRSNSRRSICIFKECGFTMIPWISADFMTL